jgi:hypothetical protein
MYQNNKIRISLVQPNNSKSNSKTLTLLRYETCKFWKTAQSPNLRLSNIIQRNRMYPCSICVYQSCKRGIFLSDSSKTIENRIAEKQYLLTKYNQPLTNNCKVCFELSCRLFYFFKQTPNFPFIF